MAECAPRTPDGCRWWVEGLGGEKEMDDSDIRWKVVRRLWNDGLVDGQPADIETVADFAVPPSAEGRAKELIRDEMVPASDCPVIWGVAGEAIMLEMKRQAVARYIQRYGGEENVPWDLREYLADDDKPVEVAEHRE